MKRKTIFCSIVCVLALLIPNFNVYASENGYDYE